MKKSYVSVVCGLVGGALVACSAPQDSVGVGQFQGRGMGNPAAPWKERFQSMDADGNGELSEPEMRDHAQGVFAAMDQDTNSALTLDEYMSVRMGGQNGFNPARQAQKQEQKQARFKPMDKNRDGAVSEGEFVAAALGRFSTADSNRDGAVSAVEFRSFHWNEMNP